MADHSSTWRDRISDALQVLETFYLNNAAWTDDITPTEVSGLTVDQFSLVNAKIEDLCEMLYEDIP